MFRVFVSYLGSGREHIRCGFLPVSFLPDSAGVISCHFISSDVWHSEAKIKGTVPLPFSVGRAKWTGIGTRNLRSRFTRC